MRNKGLLIWGVFGLVAGIVLVVFSLIKSPASTLAMAICGIVLCVNAFLFTLDYIRYKNKRKKEE